MKSIKKIFFYLTLLIYFGIETVFAGPIADAFKELGSYLTNSNNLKVLDAFGFILLFAGIFSLYWWFLRFFIKDARYKSAKITVAIVLTFFSWGGVVVLIPRNASIVQLFGGWLVLTIVIGIVLAALVSGTKWIMRWNSPKPVKFISLILFLMLLDVLFARMLAHITDVVKPAPFIISKILEYTGDLGLILGIAFFIGIIVLLIWSSEKFAGNISASPLSAAAQKKRLHKKGRKNVKEMMTTVQNELEAINIEMEKKNTLLKDYNSKIEAEKRRRTSEASTSGGSA